MLALDADGIADIASEAGEAAADAAMLASGAMASDAALAIGAGVSAVALGVGVGVDGMSSVFLLHAPSVNKGNASARHMAPWRHAVAWLFSELG